MFRDRDRRNMKYLAIILPMFAAATIHSSLASWFLITRIRDHGTTPDVVCALARQPVWYKVIGASMFIFNVLVSDIMFVRDSSDLDHEII